MSTLDRRNAVDLGGVQINIQEVTIYPMAIVQVHEGGDDIGDATHHIKIILPAQGKELRIPYNKAALRQLGQAAQKAGGIPQPASETEGNTA